MRRHVLAAAALVALAVVLAALPIGSDVYQGGEAREGLVVREMLRTGDWILPLWNGSVMPSKPPLFHWLAAAAAALTGAGVTEPTLRAPSIALAGLVVLLVFLAGRAWGGEQVGCMAALVLATTPQFLNEGGDGRVDMTLTTAVTGAQLAFVDALRGGGGPTRLVLALCLALAMLAKGPVGPGLVGLTALVSALTNRRLGPALRLVRPLPVLIFLAVAGGWYGLAYLHRGMDFVAKQIISENGEALLGGSRFPYRSPLYYLGPLVVGGLPWTLVLPWALARGWRSGELPRRHAVAWAGVVFLFFSLAPLKRAAYLLPLRAALALVIGWWLAEVAEEERTPGRLVVAARGLALAAAAGGLGLAAAAAAVHWGCVPSASLIEAGARREVDVAAYLRVAAAAWAAIAALGLAGGAAAALAARALGGARWRGAHGRLRLRPLRPGACGAEGGQAVRARRPRPPAPRGPAGAAGERGGDPLHLPRGPQRARAGPGGRAPPRRARRLLRPRPGALAELEVSRGMGGGAREPAPLLHTPPRPGARAAAMSGCYRTRNATKSRDRRTSSKRPAAASAGASRRAVTIGVPAPRRASASG